MVLPIGDAPNPRGFPLVTYALIAVNVAIYLLLSLPLSFTRPPLDDPLVIQYVNTVVRELGGRMSPQQILEQLTSYDLWIFTHAFRPDAPSFSALFLSMFLHGGLMHLFGNMLFLWIYGDNVEHRLGRVQYLFWYLATGVAATLFHLIGAAGSSLPVIGASGAISGVLGFYFVLFPRNQVRLLWMLPPFFMDVFAVPARVVLGFYLIADNLLPFLLVGGAGGGVAHGAHIGGFVAGLAAAWILDRREIAERPREYARAVADEPVPMGRVATEVDAGRFTDAARDYFALAPRQASQALEPGQALALARSLRKNGQADAALSVLRRMMREFPRAPEIADAHLHAGQILLEDLDQPTAAYQHFMRVLDLAPGPDLAAAARRGLAAIAAQQKRQVGHLRRPAW